MPQAPSAKAKQKRTSAGAELDERYLDEGSEQHTLRPSRKKRKATRRNTTTARKLAPKGRSKKKALTEEAEVEDDEVGEGDSARQDNPSQTIQQQLLKMQSLKTAASKSNLAKFREKVRCREARVLAELIARRNKRNLLKAAFLKCFSSILNDKPITNSNTTSNLLFMHHQALKTASLQLLKTLIDLKTSLKDISQNDMAFGAAWEKGKLDIEVDIQSLSQEVKAQLHEFFVGKKGGWKDTVKKAKAGMKELLARVPIREDMQ